MILCREQENKLRTEKKEKSDANVMAITDMFGCEVHHSTKCKGNLSLQWTRRKTKGDDLLLGGKGRREKREKRRKIKNVKRGR